MTKDMYLLFYKVGEDYVEKRAAYRKEHLDLAHEFAEKGHLLMGGALANPVDGAVLVFQVPQKEIIEEFVQKDPYVKNGLISSWEIRPYKVVAGRYCQHPLIL